jgi:hypothetical protein
MERDQTWQEQLDAFMQSDVAATVVRPGSEEIFARQVEDFVRDMHPGLELEELGQEVMSFLEGEIRDSRLQGISAQEAVTNREADERYDEVFTAVYELAVSRLETPAMEQGGRGLDEREDGEPSVAPTQEAHVITERVQMVMQELAALVRDREGHERSDELER